MKCTLAFPFGFLLELMWNLVLGICFEWRRGFLVEIYMCSVRMACTSFCGHFIWELVVGIVRMFFSELNVYILLI